MVRTILQKDDKKISLVNENIDDCDLEEQVDKKGVGIIGENDGDYEWSILIEPSS